MKSWILFLLGTVGYFIIRYDGRTNKSMRNILIILLFLSLPCHAQTPDKQLHLIMGTSLGAWSYLACPKQDGIMPVAFCITGATLAGIAKEAYDKNQGMTFDKKDLKYTIAGGVISATMITTVKAIVKKRKYKRHVLQNYNIGIIV